MAQDTTAAPLQKAFDRRITCAYLYPITRYGYPPDIQATESYIREMTQMGFTSIELEGIGGENIRYMYDRREQIAAMLASLHCEVPVYCVVLPQLGSNEGAETLELFEMGCATAAALGATGVLDNGPLLPLEYPANMPVMRHYSEEQLNTLVLPHGFDWDKYWDQLTITFRKACTIAAKYNQLYHLHPCEGSLITGTEAFLNFSAAVDCDNLMLNLDTANQFFLKDNLPLSVLRLANRISYIHISDNRGHRVEHLVPGDGHIHWESFFSALAQVGFSGQLAIDVGGAETGIENIEAAYRHTAGWLIQQIKNYL